MLTLFRKAWLLWLLLALALPACAGDLPKGEDATTTTFDRGTNATWDTGTSGGDLWLFPDLYSGAPFGCQNDSDCFGQRCCSTPWGVRVCADDCAASGP